MYLSANQNLKSRNALETLTNTALYSILGEDKFQDIPVKKTSFVKSSSFYMILDERKLRNSEIAYRRIQYRGIEIFAPMGHILV